MNQSTLNRITRQLDYLKTNRERLVADADTHITDFAGMTTPMLKKYQSTDNLYQGRPISAEDLLVEMNMAGVDVCLCWQNPATTPYRGGWANFESLLNSNRYIYECSCKYPERIIPTGWTDPKALGVEKAREMIRICIEDFGMPIIKMNPAQNAFPIDDECVVDLTRYIIELGAVPAFHFAADTCYTPVKGLVNLANEFPNDDILAVHMGGGGSSYLEAETMYNEIREEGLNHKNLYFIESAKRDIHIESDIITYALAGKEDVTRIFCASDAPYGRMTWNYGGYRCMFDSLINSDKHSDQRVRNNPSYFTPELEQQFLGKNFADFIIRRYTKMLEGSDMLALDCTYESSTLQY